MSTDFFGSFPALHPGWTILIYVIVPWIPLLIGANSIKEETKWRGGRIYSFLCNFAGFLYRFAAIVAIAMLLWTGVIMVNQASYAFRYMDWNKDPSYFLTVDLSSFHKVSAIYYSMSDNSYNAINSLANEHNRRKRRGRRLQTDEQTGTSLTLTYHTNDFTDLISATTLQLICQTEVNLLKAGNSSCIDTTTYHSILPKIYRMPGCTAITSPISSTFFQFGLADNSMFVADSTDVRQPASPVLLSYFDIGSCNDVYTPSEFQDHLRSFLPATPEAEQLLITHTTEGMNRQEVEETTDNAGFLMMLSILVCYVLLLVFLRGPVMALITIFCFFFSVINAAAFLPLLGFDYFSIFNMASLLILMGFGSSMALLWGSNWRKQVKPAVHPTVMNIMSSYITFGQTFLCLTCLGLISCFSLLASPVVLVAQFGAFTGFSILFYWLSFHYVIIPCWLFTTWFPLKKKFHRKFREYRSYFCPCYDWLIFCLKESGKNNPNAGGGILAEFVEDDNEYEDDEEYNDNNNDQDENNEEDEEGEEGSERGGVGGGWDQPRGGEEEGEEVHDINSRQGGGVGAGYPNSNNSYYGNPNPNPSLPPADPGIIRASDVQVMDEYGNYHDNHNHPNPNPHNPYPPGPHYNPNGQPMSSYYDRGGGEMASVHSHQSNQQRSMRSVHSRASSHRRLPGSAASGPINPVQPSGDDVIASPVREPGEEEEEEGEPLEGEEGLPSGGGGAEEGPVELVTDTNFCRGKRPLKLLGGVIIILVLVGLLIVYIITIRRFRLDLGFSSNQSSTLLLHGSSSNLARQYTIVLSHKNDLFVNHEPAHPNEIFLASTTPTKGPTRAPISLKPSVSPTRKPSVFTQPTSSRPSNSPSNSIYVDYSVTGCWGLDYHNKGSGKDSETVSSFDRTVFQSYLNSGHFEDEISSFCSLAENFRVDLDIHPDWDVNRDCLYAQYTFAKNNLPTAQRTVNNALLSWASTTSVTAGNFLGLEVNNSAPITTGTSTTNGQLIPVWLCVNFSARSYGISSPGENPVYFLDKEKAWKNFFTKNLVFADSLSMPIFTASPAFTFPLLSYRQQKEGPLAVSIACCVIGFVMLLWLFSLSDYGLTLFGSLSIFTVIVFSLCIAIYQINSTLNTLDFAVVTCMMVLFADLPLQLIEEYMAARAAIDRQSMIQADKALSPALSLTNKFFRRSMSAPLVLLIMISIPCLYSDWIIFRKTAAYLIILILVSAVFTTVFEPYLLAFGCRTRHFEKLCYIEEETGSQGEGGGTPAINNNNNMNSHQIIAVNDEEEEGALGGEEDDDYDGRSGLQYSSVSGSVGPGTRKGGTVANSKSGGRGGPAMRRRSSGQGGGGSVGGNNSIGGSSYYSRQPSVNSIGASSAGVMSLPQSLTVLGSSGGGMAPMASRGPQSFYNSPPMNSGAVSGSFYSPGGDPYRGGGGVQLNAINSGGPPPPGHYYPPPPPYGGPGMGMGYPPVGIGMMGGGVPPDPRLYHSPSQYGGHYPPPSNPNPHHMNNFGHSPYGRNSPQMMDQSAHYYPSHPGQHFPPQQHPLARPHSSLSHSHSLPFNRPPPAYSSPPNNNNMNMNNNNPNNPSPNYYPENLSRYQSTGGGGGGGGNPLPIVRRQPSSSGGPPSSSGRSVGSYHSHNTNPHGPIEAVMVMGEGGQDADENDDQE
jgi:uncharacterized membrane protein YgcG